MNLAGLAFLIALQVGQASVGIEHCHAYKLDCNTCTYCDGSNYSTCTLANCGTVLPAPNDSLERSARHADWSALMPLVGPLPPPHYTARTFHRCTYIGGSGNSPHLFDVSEIYQCDEGKIEIAGQWTQAIEYGYVFTEQLGRSAGDPHKVTASDYEDNKWCSTPTPWDANYKKRCGSKPGKCWDGKLGTWDPAWQGYSCVTPDHK